MATIAESGIRNGDLVIVNISNATGSDSTPPTSQTQSHAKANDIASNNISSDLSSAIAYNTSAEAVELDGGYLVVRVCKFCILILLLAHLSKILTFVTKSFRK